eukprot:TRINITY_DN8764_c0_g1_i1.p1 TRINITY_DN8764_c0_g1~~TRINITY_DN8764_c0_g1_i1.p1  ORF type:complete len:249 (-),score=57.49 TRINITY_DN8764_c0_g1_i1:122-790(-)
MKGVAKFTRWDIGKCEPELVYELSLKEDGSLSELFQRKTQVRALVPGCGRGYAVKALAEAGFISKGLDLSQSACKIAQEECGHPNGEFLAGDFFDSSKDLGKFDIIFDSTFLCAISPLMWRQWAKRMNDLVAPSGFLVMQVFPIAVEEDAPERDPDQPGNEPGPPNRLTLTLVRELLKPYPNFTEVLLRQTPKEREARGSFEVRNKKVKEYLMIWRNTSSSL